ncbi:MAG TPA: hypothetical protein VF555_03830 [Variovorax sp.]
MKVRKKQNPGGTSLPGFSSIPEGATPSERDRGRCQVAMLASMAWMNFMVGGIVKMPASKGKRSDARCWPEDTVLRMQPISDY